MCGILGLLNWPDIGEQEAKQLLNLMLHRGPDGQAVWSNTCESVRLGHTRLSIIDLSNNGSQPMSDSTGRFHITFNGEIYNYIEVREVLTGLGAQFRSTTDTEVILEAYKHWGNECIHKFNGMFAFAIYDAQEEVLFAARDRYGEKPLLYHHKGERFAFASEYRVLLALPGVNSNHDELKVICGASNNREGLDSQRQTVFDDIQQLLPGEALSICTQDMKLRVWKYYQLQMNLDYQQLSENAAQRLFSETLHDSIRIRMRSDVPVGSCLSGGLDSSAIVSIIRKHIQPVGEYHVFTGTFPGSMCDEWTYAQEVIKSTSVTSHVIAPTSEMLVDELQDFIVANEIPVGSSSQYAQYCVFRLAKEVGITVLLDGQGADEILAGYEQYFRLYIDALRLEGCTRRLKYELPRIAARYPAALRPKSHRLRERIPFQIRRWIAHRLNKGSDHLFGLSKSVSDQLSKLSPRERPTAFNPLSNALRQDSFGMFLTTLLRYGDRNSMAHSREVRLPFCDHRLAELVISLPPQYLMGDAQTKRILRETMRGTMPERVRTRWNKQGFLPPQEAWFRGELLEIASDVLHSKQFKESPYWNAKWWHNVIDRIKAGERNLSWSLWKPFMAECWKKYFANDSADRVPCATRATGQQR